MSSSGVEIERKWFVEGWPGMELPLLYEQSMEQGYISVRPTVRIRREEKTGEEPLYILCFKSAGGLVRKEIEFPVEKEIYDGLKDLMGYEPVEKVRRSYEIPGGLILEVNHVDEGRDTEFWYAEIEFESEEKALAFLPEAEGLSGYLEEEVTGDPGKTMGAYWNATRIMNGTWQWRNGE